MYGFKFWENGHYYIRVSNFPHMNYWGYSAKEAERKYREQFNLRYKHITWY